MEIGRKSYRVCFFLFFFIFR